MRGQTTQRGLSLVELAIAAGVLSVLLLIVTTASIRGVVKLNEMADQAIDSGQAGGIVHALEKRVRGAVGFQPRAFLADDVGTGNTEIPVDTLRGFPSRGTIAIGLGTPNAEYVQHESTRSLDGDRAFEGLERNIRSEVARAHTSGTPVHWSPFGEALTGTPPAGTFTGQTATPSGPAYFRGDATGFCFQRSIAVAGARRLGANVRGVPVEGAFSALYFEPVSELAEATREIDLNGDGDMVDVFDLGRIRMRSWSPTGEFDDVGVTPTAIVQERGAWGSADLDGDQVSDPMLVWNSREKRLQIQLVMWVGSRGMAAPFVKTESSVRLARLR